MRHHEGDEDRDKGGAGQSKEGRINQRLLYAVAQIFHLRQMIYQSHQNLRQRAARFTRGDEVDIKRWKNARELAQRLREAAALDQRLMQCADHLLHSRMLEPLFQNTQTFVERHASLLQMRELLGEHKQLTVRNL